MGRNASSPLKKANYTVSQLHQNRKRFALVVSVVLNHGGLAGRYEQRSRSVQAKTPIRVCPTGQVASTTPSGLPAWGPRSASCSDVVEHYKSEWSVTRVPSQVIIEVRRCKELTGTPH